MKEIRKIIAAYRDADHTKEKFALATVVNIEESSYRRIGARMLVSSNGEWTGGISGGCLEGDALKKAQKKKKDLKEKENAVAQKRAEYEKKRRKLRVSLKKLKSHSQEISQLVRNGRSKVKKLEKEIPMRTKTLQSLQKELMKAETKKEALNKELMFLQNTKDQ